MDEEVDDLGLPPDEQEPDQQPAAQAPPQGGPWDDYAQPAQAAATEKGPWDDYAAPQARDSEKGPWDDYAQKAETKPQNSELGNFARSVLRGVLGDWAVEPSKYLARLTGSEGDQDPTHNPNNIFAQLAHRLETGIPAAEQALGVAPQSDADKSSIGGQIGTGVAAMAPAVIATLLGGPWGGAIVGGGQMGLGGGESEAARAEQAGADPATVEQAGHGGAAIMGAGGLLMGGAAGRVLPALKAGAPGIYGLLAGIARSAVQEGVTFAGIGEAQQYLTDKLAEHLYDPSSEYHPDLKRIVSEFGTGAVLGGGMRAVGGYRTGKERAPTEPDVQADMTAAASSEPAKNSVGNAPVQPKPVERPESTGNPESAPVRSQRDYEKRRERLRNQPREPEEETDANGVDPAVAAALAPKTPAAVEQPIQPAGQPAAQQGVPPAEPAAPALQERNPVSAAPPPPTQAEPPPLAPQPVARSRMLQPVEQEHALDVARAEGEGMRRSVAPRPDQMGELAGPEPHPLDQPNPVLDRTPERPAGARTEQPVKLPAALDPTNPNAPEHGDAPPAQPIDRAIELARANNMSQKIMAVLEKARENPKLAEVVAKRFLAEYSRQEEAKARATPEVRAPEPKPAEAVTTSAPSESAAPATPPKKVKAPGSYEIKDADGRVVGRAKNEALARRYTNSLRIAKELQDRHPFPDVDPNNAEHIKALRENAKAVLKDAENSEFPRKRGRDPDHPSNELDIYLPRETKGGEARAEAQPSQTLWLAEVKAFAAGRRKPADFIAREKLLRAGDPESAAMVRSDRRAETDEFYRPHRGEAGEVTSEGNIAPKGGIDAAVQRPLKEVFHPEKFEKGASLLSEEILAKDPDIPVKTIAHGEMDTLASQHGYPHLEAFYDPNSHEISVRPGVQPDTLLHEMTHAATSRELRSNPEMNARVQKLVDFVKDEVKGAHEYALSNTREFLAHAMSDRDFQIALARLRVPITLAKELGLGARLRNGFQTFVEMVRHTLGLKPGQYSALEAAVKLTHETMDQTAKPGVKEAHGIDAAVQGVRDQADGLLRQLKGAALLKVRDTDKIAQSADRIFGGADNNPIRKIADGVEMARVKGLENSRDVDPLAKEGLDLRHADPAAYHELETLMQDESMYQRFGDLALNQHPYRTKGMNEEWKNAQHPDLERRWNALSDELKDHRAKLYDFAEARHDSLAETTAGSRLLKELGVSDKALANRVLDGSLTAADFQRLGPNDAARLSTMEVIQEAGSINKLAGPYTPFIRRGRYAVTGEFKVPGTDTALRELTPGRSWEFDSKQKAIDFAVQQHGRPHIDSYYADKTTGERSTKVTEPVKRGGADQTEPGSGRPLTQERDIPLTKNDPNTEQRWAVRVDKGYLKMHDTRREALAHEAAIARSGIFDKTDSQPKKYQPHTDAVTLASNFTNLEQRLKHNPLYENMAAKDKEAVKQLLAEHYLQMLSSTRVHNSRLHRNFVRGADDDLIRNTVDYAQETGVRMARLEHQPAIDTARKKAEEMVNEDNVNSHARRAVLNEIDSRLDAMKGGGFRLASGQMGPFQQRLMSWSYTARLATPGFTIRNLTQPPAFLSDIAGRHGFGASYRELMRVYKDIGTGHVLAQGGRDTKRAFKGQLTHPETMLEDIKNRPNITADDKYAIDYMVERGRIDPDAGFQMGETIRRPEGVKLDFFGARKATWATRAVEGVLNKLDTGLHWIEEVSRQMPRAAETINRVGMGLAAFRLEMRRNGGDREKAARYADDAVRNTQFVYSDTNKPTWQRNPFARSAFQFKQFGKSTYEFLGRHMAQSIDSQATPEERSASRKALGGLFVTHTIVAGALGLPWEPVRALLIGAKQLGWPNKEWDDVENGIREAFTGFGNLTGLNEKNAKRLGEVLSRGLPRLAGIDLSPGLGLDNMLLFGSPRSGTDREMDNNLSAWLFNMMAGAPTALQMQMISGVRDLINGDYAKGLEKLMPAKIASDTFKAGVGLAEGKVNARGRETQPPYTPYQAGLKAMGLPVGEEAERSAYQHQVSQEGTENRQAKSKLIANWLAAKTPEAKDAAARKATDNGIKPGELTQAFQRERSQERRTVNGVATTKQTRPIAERLGKVYNFNQQE